MNPSSKPGLSRSSLPVYVPSQPTTHIQYFGFAVVDCGHDDPHDAQVQTNYTSEVAGLSNIAHIAALHDGDIIGTRLDTMIDAGLAPLLDISRLLTTTVADASMPMGFRLVLRPDAASNLAQWCKANQINQYADKLAAVYLVDEPLWNGLAPSEFDSLASIAKVLFPDTPLSFVEAGLIAADIHIPSQIDWFGIDHYGTIHPDIDPNYLSLIDTAIARKSRVDQRLIVVMESQWILDYDAAGVAPEIMSTIAMSYANLAVNYPETIAILSYSWPGGLDTPTHQGARQLPDSVHQTYRMIVRELGLRD